jgi:hypothetical protein
MGINRFGRISTRQVGRNRVIKQLWDCWPELTIYNMDTKMTYIQTPDEKWTDYFSIWRRAIQEDRNTKCPSPMPFGHVMFDKIKAPPKPDQKQTEFDFGFKQSPHLKRDKPEGKRSH